MKDRCVHNLVLHGDRGHSMIDIRCYLESGHDGDHVWGKEVRRGARGCFSEGIQVEVRWHDLEIDVTLTSWQR